MKITKKKSRLLGLAATTLLIIPGITGCSYGPGGNYNGNPTSWDGTFEDSATVSDTDTESADEITSVSADKDKNADTAEPASGVKEKG